ncbi:MAG: hypothetical protein ACOX0X_02635 [Candidatus Dojkabacteria bacterium]
MSDEVTEEVVEPVAVEPVAEEEDAPRRPVWPWIVTLMGVIIIILLAILARKNAAQSAGTISDVDTTSPQGEVASVVSWKDAVEYHEGGSGPADPAGQLEGDITTVDHTNRLIVSNQDLDVRGCFPRLNDDVWKAVVAWADQWGDDSPTRIEWQLNESRCSWVFPGNITDRISESDYEDLLAIMAGAGYDDTWFVSGPEGGEFGRMTYEEMVSITPLFSRVHVYGPALSAMPTK